mmetsp:Transcript_9195/g.20845  ORF Transcript_9195/g.20845 Transcript_9195/m.20845 type:complete len:88 (+) Transcript_9195:1317-1580(+)
MELWEGGSLCELEWSLLRLYFLFRREEERGRGSCRGKFEKQPGNVSVGPRPAEAEAELGRLTRGSTKKGAREHARVARGSPNGQHIR